MHVVENLEEIADKDEWSYDKALSFKLPVTLDYVAQGNSSGQRDLINEGNNWGAILQRMLELRGEYALLPWRHRL